MYFALCENQIGVLAKISGLFAGKSYNLDTLTVGETEDPTVSRMTIEMTMDDVTFEQVKSSLTEMLSLSRLWIFLIFLSIRRNLYISR